MINPLWKNHSNTVYTQIRKRIESDYTSIVDEDKTEQRHLNKTDKQDGETGMPDFKWGC